MLKDARQWLNRLDAHCPGESDHAERVSSYAVAIADHLGKDELFLRNIRLAAMLHDLWKLEFSREHLERYPISQADIAAFRGAALNYDFPEYVKPLYANSEIAAILHPANVYDVLRQGKFGKLPLDSDDAVCELRSHPEQFDMQIVAALKSVLDIIQPVTYA